MRWGLLLLIDLFENGGLSHDQFSYRSLRGVGSAASAKGLADVVVAKHSILKHLLDWVSGLKMAGNIKDKTTDVCKNVGSFRQHYGCPWATTNQKNAKVDQTWKQGWGDAASLTISLLEVVAFGTSYDQVILQHLVNRKSAKYMCETEPLSELLDEVTDAAEGGNASGDEDDGAAAEEPLGYAPTDTSTTVASANEVNNDIAADPMLQKLEPKLTEYDAVKLNRFKQMAKTMVASNVSFAHELMDENEILEILKSCPAG